MNYFIMHSVVEWDGENLVLNEQHTSYFRYIYSMFVVSLQQELSLPLVFSGFFLHKMMENNIDSYMNWWKRGIGDHFTKNCFTLQNYGYSLIICLLAIRVLGEGCFHKNQFLWTLSLPTEFWNVVHMFSILSSVKMCWAGLREACSYAIRTFSSLTIFSYRTGVSVCK